jgi:hypothetical protein
MSIRTVLARAGGAMLLVALSLALAPGKASALPVPGGTLIWGGGDVNVGFVRSDAAYRSYLALYRPGALSAPVTANIFNSDAGVQPPALFTAPTLEAWGFAPGDELVFAIDVDQRIDGSIDHTYFMGAAARNADGVIHAETVTLGPGQAQIAFEDIWGGGDLDFDDHVFVLTQLEPIPLESAQAPSPAALLLLGASLVVVGTLYARNTRALDPEGAVTASSAASPALLPAEPAAEAPALTGVRAGA